MAEQRASCQCGGLQLAITAEPEMVMACHCQACQKRTGSPFGTGLYFQRDVVTIAGEHRDWVRNVTDDRRVINHFCPSCGSTVFWEADLRPHIIGIAMGAMDTPKPTPGMTIWTEEKQDWVTLPEDWKTYERSMAEG